MHLALQIKQAHPDLTQVALDPYQAIGRETQVVVKLRHDVGQCAVHLVKTRVHVPSQIRNVLPHGTDLLEDYLIRIRRGGPASEDAEDVQRGTN